MAKAIRTLFIMAALAALGVLLLPRLLENDGEAHPVESPHPVVSSPSISPSPDPEQAVRDLVGAFGDALKDVSVIAPEEEARQSIQENYSAYVSPQLLSQWLEDPASAPGRLVSSPWPDRIQIRSVSALSETNYEVKGEIIEVTSAEAGTEQPAAKRSVVLQVAQVEGEWRITAVELGEYADMDRTVYTNDRYGFRFSLPNAWEGYAIIEDTWAGFSGEVEEADETGPLIAIRHPRWTAQNPMQDIPIMVFTIEQWERLQEGAFYIGAAPVGPRELGRNTKYVFALPARYNFEHLTGFEEVEQILMGAPLEVIEPGVGEPVEE